jgi:hypothetical protein
MRWRGAKPSQRVELAWLAAAALPRDALAAIRRRLDLGELTWIAALAALTIAFIAFAHAPRGSHCSPMRRSRVGRALLRVPLAPAVAARVEHLRPGDHGIMARDAGLSRLGARGFVDLVQICRGR